jgi:hypothetical protein
MTKIYELVGYYEFESYDTINSNTIEDVVATFDSEKAAHAYAIKAKLKQKNDGAVFMKRSLLHGYEGYEVREREEPAVPHNPEARF